MTRHTVFRLVAGFVALWLVTVLSFQGFISFSKEFEIAAKAERLSDFFLFFKARVGISSMLAALPCIVWARHVLIQRPGPRTNELSLPAT